MSIRKSNRPNQDIAKLEKSIFQLLFKENLIGKSNHRNQDIAKSWKNQITF